MLLLVEEILNDLLRLRERTMKSVSIFILLITATAAAEKPKKDFRDRIADMFVNMGLKEDAYARSYRRFVLEQIEKGEKVAVPEDKLKYLSEAVDIEPSTQTSAQLIVPTEAELDRVLRDTTPQILDPKGQSVFERYLQLADYDQKVRLYSTENKLDLSAAFKVLEEGKKEKKDKECRTACDTVCTCAAEKICEWWCEKKGALTKPICKMECRTACVDKCKEVCYKVCE